MAARLVVDGGGGAGQPHLDDVVVGAGQTEAKVSLHSVGVGVGVGVALHTRIHLIIRYFVNNLKYFFMQVDRKWVELILSGEKRIKYAPRFVAGIGKIIFLRQNKGKANNGGSYRVALILGHPFEKTSDNPCTDKFVQEWGCGKYKNAFPIHFVLIFPEFFFDPLTYKQGSVPGLLKASSTSDLAKCRAALHSPSLQVIPYIIV